MENKMNIGYIRVSTDQQENSVISQKDMLLSYSKLHGMEIDDFFIDFGISGKNTIKREKYLELMELVKGDKVKNIITTSLSRWSRNTLDLLNSIEVLKKHHTDLMVIKENIPSLKTSMGQFFISILGSVYTLERNLTSERTKDVIKNKKKNGKVYSRTPFGFDKVDDKLIKNPYEQKVLRKIKTLRKKGSSYLSISRFLNRNNHKTKMGKKWSKENVYSLLKINRNIIGLSSINV
jgi:DNA invertase Pin-like site-specific DNA recombinase